LEVPVSSIPVVADAIRKRSQRKKRGNGWTRVKRSNYRKALERYGSLVQDQLLNLTVDRNHAAVQNDTGTPLPGRDFVYTPYGIFVKKDFFVLMRMGYWDKFVPAALKARFQFIKCGWYDKKVIVKAKEDVTINNVASMGVFMVSPDYMD